MFISTTSCHKFLLLCFPLGQQPHWSKQTVVLSASISNALLVDLYCHSWIRSTTVSGFKYFNFNFDNKFSYLEIVATNSLRNNVIDFGALQDGTLLLLLNYNHTFIQSVYHNSMLSNIYLERLFMIYLTMLSIAQPIQCWMFG